MQLKETGFFDVWTEKWLKSTYLVSVHNLFIHLCQFWWQMKSTDTFDHLLFGERLKLVSVWDHTVNMKFNVSYSTFTNVFFILVTFLYVFNVFYFNLNAFYAFYG